MSKILKILDFLNLLDAEGRLSITNVSAIILITKLALTTNPDLATIGTTAIGLLNYMHKRSVINSKETDESQGS